MQVLCQWDVQRDEADTSLTEFLSDEEVGEAIADYAAALVREFWRRRDDIDKHIDEAASGWSLSRISPVDRNTMRVALVELLVGEVPPKVALNEAIEIGREYGSEESPRFINGILDEAYRKLEAGPEDRG